MDMEVVSREWCWSFYVSRIAYHGIIGVILVIGLFFWALELFWELDIYSWILLFFLGFGLGFDGKIGYHELNFWIGYVEEEEG